ncbi:hypothetical protein KBY96_14700, partial [Cyanobium sp. ATX 6A2]|uniref:glycosyl transferase family 90 n=1 Tax=Cyanobium sp. ATX 6A2 TaxID=2823700 RepID=UPI0020CE67AD
GTFGSLKWPIHWPLYSQASGQTTRRSFAVFGSSRRIPFSGVPRLNRKRHWNYLDIIDSQDAPWSSKTDTVFWRGATTGKWNRTISPDPRSARCNLAHLLRSTSLENVDIGFSKIVQGADSIFKSIDLKVRNESIFKPAVPISEHLKHKYVLSLEGNDIATNLKWVLASSSVPLMPIPSCESWGMEFLLKPWQHFVPICHDLSDLEIKISWCRDNDKFAQEIGVEGRRYMRMFLNPNKESKIESAVIRQSMLRA